MVITKLFTALYAQLNKIANWFWTRDPIAQMQLEYDKAVAQLKEGREGLEQYRALVERVSRQVAEGEKRVETLTAKIKALLKAGDRTNAAALALELEQARKDITENREQLKMHEEAYGNNTEKIKHAAKELEKVRDKIKRYEANLKMSQAEAELAKLSQAFNLGVTTDFGEVEQMVKDKIDLNRAKTRVAADLSGEGLGRIRAEKEAEKVQAEDLLAAFEVEMGLKTPESASIQRTSKSLGPEPEAVKNKETLKQQ